ncbi:MAG: pheST operon leader peptide PheM [Symbiopectobacterium sp.]
MTTAIFRFFFYRST